MKPLTFLTIILTLFLFGCKHRKKIDRKAPAHAIHYTKQGGKKWCRDNRSKTKAAKIVCAVNRADIDHVCEMDSILVPDELSADLAYYLPFPFHVDYIEDIDKIIFFSYPTQSFGAYENGELVFTGPTNMGRRTDQTPTGLFFTNWKAEESTSSFNDEWNLRWNFNIQNELGVGWHQYEMPGYPASHSCLRLQEADAKYLYSWADQWVLKKDAVKRKGTPVIVFGSYNFDAAKPWMQLLKDPHALDISESDIKSLVKPHLKTILADQAQNEKKKNDD